nr:DNA-processing protein DprA [Halanaerobacter jeridensis]
MPAKEKEKLKKAKVKLVTLEDTCYPKLLKEIYAPPPVIYYRGALVKVSRPCLAVVGTRDCTEYGKITAYNLAKKLAEMGFVVVSGLARGIDTKAHQGALQTGMTYAILGSGLDHIYPPENNHLAEKIAQQGAVITSYQLQTQPQREHFPARNRIISGLSLGTIVIEAPQQSGALITANFSLRQGREVFAIPGNIRKRQSQGTNKLIQSGAKLVQNVDDILEELMLENYLLQDVNEEDAEDEIKTKRLNQQQKRVYNLLTDEVQQFEKILSNVTMKAKELNSILAQLEIMGLIKQLPGKRICLINQ